MSMIDLKVAIEMQLISSEPSEWLDVVRTNQAVDIAEELTAYAPQQIAELLTKLPEAEFAQLFGYFEAPLQDEILKCLKQDEQLVLFKALARDERVDVYQRLSEGEQKELLPKLAKKEREDILKLAAYEEGTAGALATSAYVSIPATLTVGQALSFVRQNAETMETIYQVFVVDDLHRLIGTCSLRRLLTSDDKTPVTEVMRTDVVTVKAEEPQQAAADVIRRYDLIAVPVTNGGDKLIGIVTVDDAMDVDEEEATEDFHKGGGTLALKDLSIKDASTFTMYRKRVFWLVLLVFGNIFSGAGIAYFEDTILAYVALVFFLPLLVDSGGNAGAQASTLMVRALATGDVVMKDWMKMLSREVGVAVLLGVTMAVAVSSIGFFRGGADIALVVSLSMVVIVVAGSLIGMSLPFLLSRMKLDPATASAPLITSIADAVGVLLYFSIAVTILGSPTA
ncbi:MAG: magnesium transporter [Idiomarina sp.]|nr:magnesium transporter [Idiomarina sp.]